MSKILHNGMRLILGLMIMLFLPLYVYAQERTLTGTVTDESNMPIPGANVVVKGTTNGTVTDINGKYRLNVSENADSLIYSFVGYVSQEVS